MLTSLAVFIVRTTQLLSYFFNTEYFVIFFGITLSKKKGSFINFDTYYTTAE